jgi:hypothetical protein
MEKKGMKLPKVDDVRKKARAIEGAKNVTLKEEDIEQVNHWLLGPVQKVLCRWVVHVNYCQIIQEKQKYRKNPRNYAMTKSRIMREKVRL